jgi:hypothetical protein
MAVLFLSRVSMRNGGLTGLYLLKNCALLAYYTASRNYHYSLSSNLEERSSQVLRGGSLKSRIVLYILSRNTA